MTSGPNPRPTANLRAARSSEPTWLRRAQATKAGALLLSWDLGAGVAVGVGTGALFAFSPDVRAQAFTFFLTLGGVSAGVAALVLAPMSMLLSALTDGFKGLIGKTPGQLAGLLLPFRQVASIAALAAASSVLVCLLALLDTPEMPWPIYWLAAGGPIGLLAWSVAGCVQVIGLSVDTLEKQRRFTEIEDRRGKAQQNRVS